VSFIRMTRSGLQASRDVREIPHGWGYFIPSLVPEKTELELRKVLSGRWRYKHVIKDDVLGVMVVPIAMRGRPVQMISTSESPSPSTD
jgi:hypothetical protein